MAGVRRRHPSPRRLCRRRCMAPRASSSSSTTRASSKRSASGTFGSPDVSDGRLRHGGRPLLRHPLGALAPAPGAGHRAFLRLPPPTRAEFLESRGLESDLALDELCQLGLKDLLPPIREARVESAGTPRFKMTCRRRGGARADRARWCRTSPSVRTTRRRLDASVYRPGLDFDLCLSWAVSSALARADARRRLADAENAGTTQRPQFRSPIDIKAVL